MVKVVKSDLRTSSWDSLETCSHQQKAFMKFTLAATLVESGNVLSEAQKNTGNKILLKSRSLIPRFLVEANQTLADVNNRGLHCAKNFSDPIGRAALVVVPTQKLRKDLPPDPTDRNLQSRILLDMQISNEQPFPRVQKVRFCCDSIHGPPKKALMRRLVV